MGRRGGRNEGGWREVGKGEGEERRSDSVVGGKEGKGEEKGMRMNGREEKETR